MSSVNGNQSSIRHFYDLEIWKEAHRLSIAVYKLSDEFPKKETYGISDQLRRSSTSVSANIAEGFGRYHYKDKIKFYYNARGSICEVQNFIFFAQDIGYLSRDLAREVFQDYEKLGKMLNIFIKSTQKKITSD